VLPGVSEMALIANGVLHVHSEYRQGQISNGGTGGLRVYWARTQIIALGVLFLRIIDVFRWETGATQGAGTIFL